MKAVIVEDIYQRNCVRSELVDNSAAGLCEVRPEAEVSLIVLLDADVELCRGLGETAHPDQPGQTAARLLGHGRRYGGHPRAGDRITAEAMPRSGHAEVLISDDAAGIAEHDLPYIFDRFYRADRSRTRATGGRGLGLTISGELIEAHGGTISVTSTPGAGSRFYFTVPVLRDDEHETKPST